MYTQTNESNNMTATSSNASSMEANITGSNANDTGMGAPHASNMTPEQVLAPNGTAPRLGNKSIIHTDFSFLY